MTNDKSHERGAGTVVLAPDIVENVRRRVADRGLPAAARALGVTEGSVLRVLGGTGVRRGTAALIEAAAARGAA